MKRLWLILFILFSSFLFADEKTFIREYTYQASDYDSKVTSRANALEQVKRLLLEEVSVYMQSEFEMKDWEEQIGDKIVSGEFAEQRILSITAGITETKILEEKWTGVEYWIKAEITLDPDDIKSKIDDIVKNKEKLKELEDVKKKADNALVEIERLKKELAEAQSDADQLRLTKAYNKETDVLSATDWFNKAYNAHENKEYDKAILFYLRVIELDPDYAWAYINLGLVYGNQGNKTKAIELFEKAIELDPDIAIAYNNLGFAYKDQGNITKAIQLYEKAIELDPDYAWAYINLGFAYKDQGNITKAIESFEKAIELDPDIAIAYNNLGFAYHNSNPDKALIYYKKAARLGHKDIQDWLKKNGHEW
jgi:tetratricopeptide (TPR) repeat protein